MKPYRHIAWILVLGISASFAFGMLRGGTTLATYRWGPDAPGWQETGSAETPPRELRTPSWELDSLLATEVVGPATASILRPGPGGSLLIQDYRAQEIWQIDPATEKNLRRIRAAGAILDFGSDAAGNLWWLEDGRRHLLRQDSGGEPSASSPLASLPHRVARAEDGGFVALTAEARPELFRAYPPEGAGGSAFPAFGRFLDGEVQDPLVLEGTLASLPGGGFVYAPHYLPFLAAFSSEGRRLFAVPLAAATPGSPPAVVRGARNSRNIEPGTRVESYSVHIAEAAGSGDPAIAVLTAPSRGAKGERVLDLYRPEDGRYLHSLKLPKGTRDALLSGGELFTLHRDGIRRWRRSAGPAAPREPG